MTDNLDSADKEKISAADLYLAAVLHRKGSRVANRKIHIGEFLYNHEGDFVGFYVGNGHVSMIEECK